MRVVCRSEEQRLDDGGDLSFHTSRQSAVRATSRSANPVGYKLDNEIIVSLGQD